MEADAAGVATKLVYLQQMEYSHELGRFVDQDGIPIKIWFKLYPLSWLLNEPNGKFIPKAQLRIIEPPWKALLDHKGLLVVLSELFPNHPNILPCSFSPEKFSAGYVRKPIGGIQGSNVSVHLHGKVILKEGNFGEETAVYQPFIETTVQDGRHAVLGSWIIGDRYAGFGIRDSLGLITDTTCLFLPHVIT
jgi:glutathionylspermidine synthase